MIAKVRRITLCLDCWSKKSLSCSFLGISVGLYDHDSNSAKHIVMNVKIVYPHTGKALAAAVRECLVASGIKHTPTNKSTDRTDYNTLHR